MKKLLSIMLTLVLLFCFSACQNSDGTTKKETADSSTSETNEAITTPDANEQDEYDGPYKSGITTETTYENEYFNIGFKIDEKWKFLSQEKMYKYYKMDPDFNGYDENSDVTKFPEVYATNGYGNTIEIMVEKNTELTADMTIEERVKAYGETLAKQAESKYDKADIKYVTIDCAKQKFHGIEIDIEDSGLKAHQLVYLAKGKDFVATVTLSRQGSQDCYEYLDWFYKV